MRLEALSGQINPMDSWSIQPLNWCTTLPYQINQKESDHTWKACHHMKHGWNDSILSLEHYWKGQVDAAAVYGQQSNWKIMKPVTAASCLTKRPTEWVSKKGPALHFTQTNYQVENCKFRDQVGGSKILPRKVFPEGFMPPWRIQHESHTCSELSLRIRLWRATIRAKTPTIKWQNEYTYIYI